MTRCIGCGALLALAISGGMVSAQTLGQASGPWVLEKSGSTAGLRGIHAVGGGVAWASGTNGTVLRTEDGGYQWQSCAAPPDGARLDFRGIWAWDDQTAIIMSSGTGDASRLYKTTDGCSSWKLLFTNPDKEGFWDGIVFLNRDRGYMVGDPVRGKIAFFTTKDGGTTWTRSDSADLASGPEASGAFAASNSSLLGRPNEPVAFGTVGASYLSQSFRMTIRLSTSPEPPAPATEEWARTAVPLANKGESAGIFSLGFHEGPVHGYGYTLVAVGGNYQKPNETAGTAAWSADGGKTWTASTKPPHGFRSAVAWDADLKAWIAAGTNGSDISWDDGKTWQPLDDGNWNALSLPWVAGPNGRIAKLDPSKISKP